MKTTNIEHEYQNGFKEGTQTADNLFILSTLIDQAKAENKELHACFIDLKTAYDSVDREQLIKLFEEIGAGNKFTKLLSVIMKDVPYQVLLNKEGQIFRKGKGNAMLAKTRDKQKMKFTSSYAQSMNQ